MALRAVGGRDVVRRALAHWHGRRTQDPAARYAVFAVGKAAREMWQGAHDVLGERIEAGIVVAKDIAQICAADPCFAKARVFDGAHPLPDQRSLAAGAALQGAVDGLHPDCFPILLISGGASSLVEVLHEGVSLDDAREIGARGLATGLPIEVLNSQRAAFSALKGGGLSRRLAARPALALFISDVPGDDPAVIGSGLLAPTPGDHIERQVIASIEDALAAVEREAATMGLTTHRRTERLTGEAADQGRQLAQALRQGPPGLLIAGGETTVVLPPQAGQGGRNQHLALAAAEQLAGHERVWLLAVGTDGVDGTTGDAGALVSGASWQAALDAGIDPAAGLRRADAATVLEAAGDVVHTGPTGTNVGDLVIGLKVSSAQRPASSAHDVMR